MASKLVMIIAYIFFLVGFSFAITAERRSTGHPEPDGEQNNNYCVYGSHIATWLGSCASISLAVGQIIIMVASKCLCCGKPLKPGVSRTRAILLFITSWFFCLLARRGTLNLHTGRVLWTEQLIARKGVFAGGATFTLVTGIISEIYYMYYSKARVNFSSSGGENEVGMLEYK